MRTIASFLLVFTLFFGAISPAPTYAAGTNDGVRVIRNDDGTTYLSSEIDAQTQASAAAEERRQRSGSFIVIPDGFARNIAVFINALLTFVMIIAALLVFMYLIWGGIDWITAGNDSGKTDKARQKIMNAVIGLIVLAASYAILLLVLRFLGFRDLNDVLYHTRNVKGELTPITATSSAETAQ